MPVHDPDEPGRERPPTVWAGNVQRQSSESGENTTTCGPNT